MNKVRFTFLILITLFLPQLTEFAHDVNGVGQAGQTKKHNILIDHLTSEENSTPIYPDPMENLLDRPGEDSPTKVLILTDDQA
ncbi:MAG: hypothetical protein JSW42_05375, partial [Chloroflexota bacterium]